MDLIELNFCRKMAWDWKTIVLILTPLVLLPLPLCISGAVLIISIILIINQFISIKGSRTVIKLFYFSFEGSPGRLLRADNHCLLGNASGSSGSVQSVAGSDLPLYGYYEHFGSVCALFQRFQFRPLRRSDPGTGRGKVQSSPAHCTQVDPPLWHQSSMVIYSFF